MPEPLTRQAVEHVAKLARLSLDETRIEHYRRQLSTVLKHIAMLEQLDVEGVEPMAHPMDVTNRLAEDEPGPPMGIDALLDNAPACEGRYLAVPKVLEDSGGG